MAILKKSNRSPEKKMLPFLFGDSEKTNPSSENTSSISKSAPSKSLLRGVQSSNILTIERLKDITAEPIELPPTVDIPMSFSTQEETPKPAIVPAPRVDQREIDRQIQEYRKKSEIALQSELDSKRTYFMAQLEREKAQILDQGYHDGYAQGEQEGKEILENQAEELFKAMNQLTQEKGDVFAEAKPEIIKLSVKIAEKIIQKAIANQPDLFEGIIDEAIAKVTDKDKVIIRVNPAQIDTVRKYKDRLLERINDIKSLEFQDDPKIENGGCMIETKLGYVDATLSIKLATLQNALFKAMEDEEFESGRA